MNKKQSNDNCASDVNKFLSTEDDQLIELDTPSFLTWLENNHSFRFEAGTGREYSYRARKEKGNYWYAVKKVKGKLHKRFIGTTQEVTHNRLIEVAQQIMQPPKSRLHNTTSEVKETTVRPQTTPADNQVQSQIDELRQLVLNQSQEINQLRQLVLNQQTETSQTDLEAENKRLQEENQKLQDRIIELTNQLDNTLVNHKTEIMQLQDNVNQLEAEKANLQQSTITPDYEAVRDRVLAKLKLGRQSTAGKAIEAFIKELSK